MTGVLNFVLGPSCFYMLMGADLKIIFRCNIVLTSPFLYNTHFGAMIHHAKLHVYTQKFRRSLGERKNKKTLVYISN